MAFLTTSIARPRKSVFDMIAVGDQLIRKSLKVGLEARYFSRYYLNRKSAKLARLFLRKICIGELDWRGGNCSRG